MLFLQSGFLSNLVPMENKIKCFENAFVYVSNWLNFWKIKCLVVPVCILVVFAFLKQFAAHEPSGCQRSHVFDYLTYY